MIKVDWYVKVVVVLGVLATIAAVVITAGVLARGIKASRETQKATQEVKAEAEREAGERVALNTVRHGICEGRRMAGAEAAAPRCGRRDNLGL